MGQGFPSQRIGVNISAGTQLAQTGTVVFSNSNGMSFGMNSNASSSIVTGAYGISAGTAQATGGASGVVFSNSNGISFGANGGTITAQMPSVSLFRPDSDIAGSFSIVPSSGTTNMSVRRFSIPFQISATELDMLAHLTVAASTAGSFTLSAALYTFAGSTASSASSASVGYTFNSGTNSTAASIYGGNSGTRWRTMSVGTWNLTPGEYLMAIIGSIAGVAGTTGSMTIYGNSNVSNAGVVGGGNFSQYWGDGIFSAGTSAFPASIHLSAINQTGGQDVGQPNFRLIGTGP